MSTHHIIESIQDVLPPISLRTIIFQTLGYFTAGFMIATIILFLIIHSEHKVSVEAVGREQVSRLKLMEFIITHDLETVAADVRILIESALLMEYVNNPSMQHETLLGIRFRNFLKDRQNYIQARLIDRNGYEKIRVNMEHREPTSIPRKNMQYKGDRYYFQEAQGVNKNELYVSPLDLNVENGKIDIPYMPVLRVGTPLFDHKGTKQGIVMLNLRAEEILNRYTMAYGSNDGYSFSIVNENGYWIRNDQKEKEWGFMLNHEHTLSKEQPRLWERLQSSTSGQHQLDNGLYSFLSLFPEQLINHRPAFNNKNKTATHDDSKRKTWHLVLSTPTPLLSYSSLLKQHRWVYAVVPFVLVCIACFSLYLAVSRQRRLNRDRIVSMLTTAMEQSPAPVIITDIYGRIKYANPKFERMTGYDRHEVLNENPRIFKSGNTVNHVYQDLWKTILQGREWRGEFENKRKDNTPYYVEAQIAPLLDMQGNIVRIIALQEDITEKKILQQKLNKLATTDGLTEVFNRNTFLQLFKQEVRRIERYGQPLTVLVFDLDHFKSVNDTYGHHAGDHVLIQFAKTITTELRDSDIFGRMGGEEFAAVLVETDEKGGRQLADRLRQKTEQLRVCVDGQDIHMTVSIGCTSWQKSDSEVEEVLKRADRALYSAKHAGRNRVVFYNS